MMDRRKFLRAALFVAAAPVIVKASSLMPIRAARHTWMPMIEPLEFTGPSTHLRALIESIRQTKEIMAANILAHGNYFGYTKLSYVNGKFVATNVPPAEVELSFLT